MDQLHGHGGIVALADDVGGEVAPLTFLHQGVGIAPEVVASKQAHGYPPEPLQGDGVQLRRRVRAGGDDELEGVLPQYAAAQAQGHPDPGPQGADLFRQLAHVGDVLPPLLIEAFPRFRELHALVAPVEEHHSQLLLHETDLPGNGGLGHVELAGGAAHAALLHHRAEVFQLSNGHFYPPYSKSIAKIPMKYFLLYHMRGIIQDRKGEEPSGLFPEKHKKVRTYPCSILRIRQ